MHELHEMQTGLFETEGLLMALLPGLGPRAALGPVRAELKWAGPGSLTITRSAIEFLDSEGRVIGQREGAFRLTPGIELQPLYSHWLVEDVGLPRAAMRQRWNLNGWIIEAPVVEPETAWGELSLTCLPLQVPLPHDDHLIAALVNIRDQPLDIAQGVREAVCFVDGEGWPSAAGRVWNGPYLVRPGHSVFRRFRLADFPGVPVTGLREVILEMSGRRSSPQRVHWHGEPWLPDAEIGETDSSE